MQHHGIIDCLRRKEREPEELWAKRRRIEMAALAAAQAWHMHMLDLPSDEDAEKEIEDLMKKADKSLAKAELYRRAAVVIGTEIQRGADGRGYIINNDDRPRMVPAYIKWAPDMVAYRYRSIRPPGQQHEIWATIARKSREYYMSAIGPAGNTGPAGSFEDPTVDVCRITAPLALERAKKMYNDARGKMHTQVRFANRHRHVVLLILARIDRAPNADQARHIPRFFPHRETDGEDADQAEARDRFQAWMRKIAVQHGRIAAPVPDIGIPRSVLAALAPPP
jgi:hypothetical protein